MNSKFKVGDLVVWYSSCCDQFERCRVVEVRKNHIPGSDHSVGFYTYQLQGVGFPSFLSQEFCLKLSRKVPMTPEEAADTELSKLIMEDAKKNK
jgi:hypothetical protein